MIVGVYSLIDRAQPVEPGAFFVVGRICARRPEGHKDRSHVPPLTGAYSVSGRDQQRATKLAVNEWNAKGGSTGSQDRLGLERRPTQRSCRSS